MGVALRKNQRIGFLSLSLSFYMFLSPSSVFPNCLFFENMELGGVLKDLQLNLSDEEANLQRGCGILSVLILLQA